MTIETTLAQFNMRLIEADIGAGTLTPDQYNHLKASSCMTSILHALDKAKNDDPGARKYVEQSLANICPSTGARSETDTLVTASNDNGNGQNAQKRYISHHVYGKSSALEFSGKRARNEWFETVFIDAAKVIPNSRNINWKAKITVQLIEAELLIVAAVFCSHLDNCHFANHGSNKDKGFEILRNPKTENRENCPFLVKVFQKDRDLHVVPMTRSDTFYVSQILLTQLQKNLPHQDIALMLAGLRLMGNTT
jgi:hypothetical protein